MTSNGVKQHDYIKTVVCPMVKLLLARKVTHVVSPNCIIRRLCKLRHSANESTSVEQNTFPTWGDATENSFAINNNMYTVTQRCISMLEAL